MMFFFFEIQTMMLLEQLQQMLYMLVL